MPSVQTVEQAVADWFNAKLRSIKKSDGYSMTILKDSVWTDGDPDVAQGPAVPFAEYQDNTGSWRDQSGGRSPAAILEYQAAVRVTDVATAGDYKRRGRAIFDDVARACNGGLGEESMLPLGVVSILPDGWTRQLTDGNYLEVIINFTVRLGSDLRRRPLP